MKKLGFIGMGNMAGAIAGGIIRKGVIASENIYAFDLDLQKLEAFSAEYKINPCKTAQEMIQQVDTVLVAVKPYYVSGVIQEIRDLLKDKVLLSVAAGWDYDKYESVLDKSTRHLFIMPNTPALVGEGVLLFEEKNSLSAAELEQAKHLFSALGTVQVLTSELMDIGGTVSSCSPAFLSMVIEAMADAAVMYGLPRETAYKLASQAMVGTGKMQMETGLHPGQIKDMVCSPKGSTIRGVAALEKTGLRNAVISSIDTVMNR